MSFEIEVRNVIGGASLIVRNYEQQTSERGHVGTVQLYKDQIGMTSWTDDTIQAFVLFQRGNEFHFHFSAITPNDSVEIKAQIFDDDLNSALQIAQGICATANDIGMNMKLHDMIIKRDNLVIHEVSVMPKGV